MTVPIRRDDGLRAKVKQNAFVRTALAVQKRYGEDSAGSLASAIAYHAFFSLFPLLLLALSVLGFFLSDRPDLRTEWTDRLSRSVPGLSGLIGDNLDTIVQNRVGTGLVSLAGLFWTGMSVVQAAGHSLGIVFRIPDHRAFLKNKAWAIGSLASMGTLGLLSVALTGLVAGLRPGGAAGVLVLVFGSVLSAGMDFVLFLIAYRVLTQRRGPPFGILVPGAALAAAGWTALKLAGSWYAERTVAGATAVYGTFAATIGALVILSMVARLFMYGAVLNALTAERTKAGGAQMATVRPIPGRDDRRSTEHAENGNRSTARLVRDIAVDTSTLVRKEVELARQEIVEALVARVRAVAMLAGAGVLALFGVVFLGRTVAAALDGPLADWAAHAVVALGFFVLAGVLALWATVRAKSPSLMPEETKKTVKEDREWAKGQLKR